MAEPIDLRKQPSPEMPQMPNRPSPVIQPRQGLALSERSESNGWWHKMTGQPMKLSEKIIAAIAVVIFLFILYVTVDANKYQATVHVIAGEGKVGVNPTTERLDFGDLSPGTSAARRVSVENNTPIPVYVAVIHLGSINDLMQLDKNFFVLSPHKSTELEFTVYMPASAPIGQTLNGRVFLFKIPGPWR